MLHIRQKNSEIYTVVIVPENQILEQHHSIVKYPDLFEIVDAELPEVVQYLNVPVPQVPEEIALWRIRAVLAIEQKEAHIDNAISQLPEPQRTAANYVWKYGTTIERNSQTVLFIQQVLSLTNNQVDEFFMAADAIQL